MLFSSPVFLFGFLPVLLAMYFLCPKPARNVLLLLASLWFYAWGEPALVVLMLISTGMNYAFGYWVGNARDQKSAKVLVAVAVAINLSFLVYFKYAGFLIESLNALLDFIGTPTLDRPDVTLPIGISFYTFQAMSYVIDVYRGQAQAEKNPINVALYIALFPQLIAGPIVRYVDVAAQIKDRDDRCRRLRLWNPAVHRRAGQEDAPRQLGGIGRGCDLRYSRQPAVFRRRLAGHRLLHDPDLL